MLIVFQIIPNMLVYKRNKKKLLSEKWTGRAYIYVYMYVECLHLHVLHHDDVGHFSILKTIHYQLSNYVFQQLEFGGFKLYYHLITWPIAAGLWLPVAGPVCKNRDVSIYVPGKKLD